MRPGATIRIGRLEVPERVDLDAAVPDRALPHLEVEVGARAPAGAADASDTLPASDTRALAHPVPGGDRGQGVALGDGHDETRCRRDDEQLADLQVILALEVIRPPE